VKVRFDPEADALYVRLLDAEIVESEEVKPGVVLDFDSNNRLVGFEMLDVGRRLPEADLKKVVFEIASAD